MLPGVGTDLQSFPSIAAGEPSLTATGARAAHTEGVRLAAWLLKQQSQGREQIWVRHWVSKVSYQT